MHVDEDFTEGIFRRELKNRFRCVVEVEGEEKLCYVASSSRLMNFIDLTDKEVLLLPSSGKASKTAYTLFASRYRNSHIILSLSLANEIMAEQLSSRRFSFLGSRKQIQRERTVAGYKADLYIEDTKTIIEIKTIVSDQKSVIFPSVYTERGIRQLIQLKELLDKGFKGCLLLAVLSPSVREIIINREDEYGALLYDCVERGLECRAYGIRLKQKDLTVNNYVPVAYR